MLNLICGDVACGKTSTCIRKMREIRQFKPYVQIYYIVPEQYSFLAEKLIVESFGGNGVNGIDILSFSKMKRQFLHTNPCNYLDKSGKSILVTKAIEASCDENSIYYGSAKKIGFSNTISRTLSDFKKHMITPQIIFEAADKTSNKNFAHKLNSLAKIYEKYEELNDGRFFDSENDLLFLSNQIISENLFSDSYVFIDEFADFTPQHYKVISALMKNCAQVYITLTINDDKNNDIFVLPQKTKETLINVAKKNTIPFEINYIDNIKNPFFSDEIKFLFDNYTSFNSKTFKKYQQETSDICVFSALDKYSEVEYAAKRITALISDKKTRYSDITVACADKEEYSDIIEAIFADYKIPYFTDTNIDVINHPVIMTVLGLFSILSENWSVDSVFSYLKSGFIYYIDDDGTLNNFDYDDVDFLYSYVLKRGIRGKKKWLAADDWRYDIPGLSQVVSESIITQNEDADKRINSLRKKIVSPIESFINKTRGRNRITNLAKAIFEFLEDIHLHEGILLEIKRLDEKGMRNEAEQFAQIWNILVNVIDQTVIAIGDEFCSKEQFFNYLTSGFGECEIAIIPSSLDCVTISSADEAVQKSVDNLIILGALRGNVPNEIVRDDIFSKKDKQELQILFDEDDIEFCRSDEQLKVASEYRFYKMLSNARKRIIITHPVTDNSGEATVPAQIIGNLHKMFEHLTHEDDLVQDLISDEVVFSPKSAYNYLMRNRNNKNDLSVKRLYEWFSDKSEWQDRLNMIKFADDYKREAAKINKKSVSEIYNDNSPYSISRLNEYSQCPFKYFIKNGLKAKEEEIWQIHKFDLGSLMHYAIYKFCKTIEEESSSFIELQNKWSTISEEECDKIIDSIIKDMLDKISTISERDEGKINYLINRMSKTLKRSIHIVRKSIISGEYIPVEYEKNFYYNLDDNISIRGTIDRIDLAFDYDEQKAGIRIIDYKSGSKKFSVSSVCNMIDIQLVVYALAAVELYKKGEIKYSKDGFFAEVTAVMYNKLRDDMTKIEKVLSENDIDKVVNANMKLDGPIIVNNDENGEVNADTVIKMGKNIINELNSDFLDIKVTSKCKIDKRASVISKEDFNSLLNYAKKNIKKHNKLIKQGDIKIMPYKEGDSLSCKYCEMSEICLFDSDKDIVRHLCTNDKLAWEIIKKDIE